MEAIRLVIWDLDETFWHGTLTEGGIAWREESEHAVRTLAARGIISAICSKNDPADVRRVLREHRMRRFFVFNSISWEAKGPRLAAQIAAIQLRPQSVLFIDDNALNRAEAGHFVPGLQIADETIVPALLEDARCAGKPDAKLTRLAQYKLLERRQKDAQGFGDDTTAFLRDSSITVRLEYDVAAHLDRAVELINRTNQLNFTKSRLPEDSSAACAQLRILLSEHNIQAALVHVRDKYGDYGFCGIYVMRSQRHVGRLLLHFAFSCRILGNGLETWLWRRLERPTLTVVGPVLTDIQNDPRDVDWIGIELAGAHASGLNAAPRQFAYVLARGACDMRALAHYFSMVAERVYEEFDTVRNGQAPLVNHSLIAYQAMNGIDACAVTDFAPLGFLPEDFTPVMVESPPPPPPGPAVWLLSFTVEAGSPIFRHLETGALLPAYVEGLKGHPAAFMAGSDDGEVDPAVAAHLRAKFAYDGPMPENLFRSALRAIFGRAGADVRVFILLGNTRVIAADGSERVIEHIRRHNAMIAAEAATFANIALLTPADFMSTAEVQALHSPHHFDRMVYYRMYQHIMAQYNSC